MQNIYQALNIYLHKFQQTWQNDSPRLMFQESWHLVLRDISLKEKNWKMKLCFWKIHKFLFSWHKRLAVNNFRIFCEREEKFVFFLVLNKNSNYQHMLQLIHSKSNYDHDMHFHHEQSNLKENKEILFMLWTSK